MKGKNMRDYLQDSQRWLQSPVPLRQMLAQDRTRVIAALVQFLGNGDEMKRKWGAYCLGQIGDDTVLPVLKQAHDREDAVGVQDAMGAALAALTKMPARSGVGEVQRCEFIEDVYKGNRPDEVKHFWSSPAAVAQERIERDSFGDSMEEGPNVQAKLAKVVAGAFASLEKGDFPAAAAGFHAAYMRCSSTAGELGLRAQICFGYGHALILLHNLEVISERRPPTTDQQNAMIRVNRLWTQLLAIVERIPPSAHGINTQMLQQVRTHWTMSD